MKRIKSAAILYHVALLAALLSTSAEAIPPALPRRAVPLNGEWQIQKAQPSDTAPSTNAWQTMKVPGIAPHDWAALWLERDMEIPADWTNSRWFVRSEMIEQPAVVFVDDSQAGIFTPPGNGLDITATIKPGKKQKIRLFLSRNLAPTPQGPPGGNKPNPLGITGSLRLDAVAPEIAIDDVFLMPSTQQKALNANIDFLSSTAASGITLLARVTDQDGKTIHSLKTTLPSLPAGESTQSVSFPWADPILWELDRPHLYTIEITAIATDGSTLDTWGPDTFGFREFWVEGKEMMLNGHPCRFRLFWHWGVSNNNIAFFQGIGFNALEIQPRGRPWFSVWGRHDEIDAVVDTLDHHGVALIAPLKSLEGVDFSPKNLNAEETYARACKIQISRYKNHPSILVWNMGINICTPNTHWMPPHIGQNLSSEEEKIPVYSLIARGSAISQELDPTRSVISHAAGNTAPIASANVYLNFIPIQEREEWLSIWGTSGKKPFSAIEFGPPYIANFWHKGAPDPHHTEYAAMFLGDDAYRMDDSHYVARMETMTLSNPSGHGGHTWGPNHSGNEVNLAETETAFFPVVTEFVRRTTRAWRTWGQNAGNHPWMWNVGFGGKPSGPMGCFFYADLQGSDEELRRRPSWANPYYDVYRETQQPLLVYIAGSAARFTAKDHSFFPGETMEKQIIAIWDAGWNTDVTAEWEALLDGARIAGDTLQLALAPAEVRKLPITIPIPATITQRGHGEIRVKVKQNGQDFSNDSFHFQVLPQPVAAATRPILFWDPANESSWVKNTGASLTPWQPGQPLAPSNTLIIGRNALSNAQALPFTTNDLYRGLTVIILEQQRQALRRFGFRAEDTCSRKLFPRQPNHPLLQGIQSEDLADWRGKATLVPEQTPLDLNPARPRCMHWGNYGIVASVVLEVPHHGNFTPVIDGEFDMRYSPLLEWRYGSGRVLFSQLDLTGRVGKDPVASTLAHNLMTYANAETAPNVRKTAYIGGPHGRAFIQRLQFNIDTNAVIRRLPENSVIILGEVAKGETRSTRRALERFVKEGGTVLSLSKTPEELSALLPFKVQTELQKKHRIENPSSVLPTIGDGLGPADLRWRDFGDFHLFTTNGLPPSAQVLGNGFFLQYPQEKGTWLLCQVDPRQFDDDIKGMVSLLAEWPESGYSDDGGRKADLPKPWLRLSRQRIERLYSQLFSNLGIDSSPALARRMTLCIADPELRAPTSWQMTRSLSTKDSPTPPEPEWLAKHPGQPMPAVEWLEAQGTWSPSRPDAADGWQCATFARTAITSSLPYEVKVPVRYKFEFHNWGSVWFNGERIARLTNNRWSPRLGIESMVTLKPGHNELLIKFNGRAEVQVALQDAPDERLGPDGPDILYRDPIRFGDDPYAWFPW